MLFCADAVDVESTGVCVVSVVPEIDTSVSAVSVGVAEEVVLAESVEE